ncbi:MAG: hypothetical protein WCI72_06710 [archaeon]
MSKQVKNIFLELLPVIIAIIVLTFITSEIALFFIILVILLVSFKIKYLKREFYVFLFGLIAGIIFELIGNSLLGQTWGEASFFRIPIWLPLSWGYAFVIIRRIGDLIIGKD